MSWLIIQLSDYVVLFQAKHKWKEMMLTIIKQTMWHNFRIFLILKYFKLHSLFKSYHGSYMIVFFRIYFFICPSCYYVILSIAVIYNMCSGKLHTNYKGKWFSLEFTSLIVHHATILIKSVRWYTWCFCRLYIDIL